MKIAIYGQYYQNSTEPIIRDIFVFLNANHVDLVIEETFLTLLYEKGILKKSYRTFTKSDDLEPDTDLMLSIGGDGTILRAALLVQDKGIPILGVNAGRLGFLAKVPKEDIDAFLQLVLDRKYSISERSLLQLQGSLPADSGVQTNFAVNEISVNRKDSASMITVDTFLNGEFLTSYWADGLIIATPTGSTGYSLSCGGPILTPAVAGFVITPLAPHNLNARPMVIPDSTQIRLRVSGRESQHLVSLDAQSFSVQNETELIIEKAAFTLKMIEFPEETFLKTLRKKLLWGEDKRN
ncbi:NAD kinase [Flavobacterium aurantiibacter]|uniref:NAD kinase n=1 Tax=Flavobacterium aurantiibacter TaxID=2023067 RepID=A0A255ZJ41_9FLAO|nr:NAD kinase [Flavobacterium aurantiibacter]OYQ41506.1 NAD kinase [Flavobacterium aurantiibacter]